jgi:hypothetical protein
MYTEATSRLTQLHKAASPAREGCFKRNKQAKQQMLDPLIKPWPLFFFPSYTSERETEV